ncbi:hypothetical protein HED60_22160 [Planctomycetales bacterium ZRK34]|nr:hypothetical protein HED60_22160 [Planctomycetales bacterium ZRK34]
MATYQELIGYDDLIAQLGDSAPDGTGIKVAQAEAVDGEGNYAPFLQGTTTSPFAGKTISLKSGTTDVSSHAFSTAFLFYSNNGSLASGVTEIDSYNADGWLSSDFLRAFGSSLKPLVSDARLANHSWVVTSPSPDTSLLPSLRRLDWVVLTDDFIQVVGENNSNTTAAPDLNSGSFNAIVVGRTDGNSSYGTGALDSTYVADRAKPDIVAPATTTSSATPMVSSVAVALVQFAHENPSLSLDRTSVTVNRAGLTIYQAETSEAIKAMLMAGAERRTYNQATTASTTEISDYRDSTSNQKSNGLDRRYGAGQVNIFHSYQMIAAGQTDSVQDGGSGAAGTYGYDYDEHFGGDNSSNTVASYTFTARPGANLLTSSLAWNLDVNGGSGPFFDGDTTLYNLDLTLYDQTDTSTPVAISASTIDNTENLRTALLNGHTYELRVTADTSGGNFDWDYALGWRLVADHGDWDHDADIDVNDINLLAAAIGTGDLQFDLNVDGSVDRDDLNVMINQLVRTPLGDANLDGFVDIADLTRLSQNYGGSGGWGEGDFNGDGLVDIADLTILSSHYGSSDLSELDPAFGYSDANSLSTLVESQSTFSTGLLISSTPEPTASIAMLFGAATLGRSRLRRRR